MKLEAVSTEVRYAFKRASCILLYHRIVALVPVYQQKSHLRKQREPNINLTLNMLDGVMPLRAYARRRRT